MNDQTIMTRPVSLHSMRTSKALVALCWDSVLRPVHSYWPPSDISRSVIWISWPKLFSCMRSGKPPFILPQYTSGVGLKPQSWALNWLRGGTVTTKLGFELTPGWDWNHKVGLWIDSGVGLKPQSWALNWLRGGTETTKLGFELDFIFDNIVKTTMA